MSRMRILTLLAVLGATLACGLPSQAIPVFARKYGFNCTMCHSAYPRLNDYGERYRQNGYQLPGRENEEQTVLQGPAPFAVRATAGYNYDRIRNVPGAESVNQFQIVGVDLLSGGLFKENIGYIFVFPPEINGSRGVAAQPGTVEMANVVFSNLGSSWLNVRAGRFEPAYNVFSVKRSLSFSPYEIYDFSFPSGLAFSTTQSGVELYGYGLSGFQYFAGWVDGADSNESDDSPADFYVRGVKVFGRGEGQTTGQRIGLTGYFGKARPEAGLPQTDRESFHRIAADASLNLSQWNLALQYITGSDDAALWGASSDVDFSGGFAELTYMPAFDLAAFARYGWVDPDRETGISDIKRWVVGGRYYLYDNIALHLEFSNARQENVSGPDETEKFFTTRLDFAF